jgi:hypothetical protein
MHVDEMLSLFHQHRKAEASRDFDTIMATFVEDCYLETVALNLRIEGRTDDEGLAFGDDVLVTPSWASSRVDGPLRCRS